MDRPYARVLARRNPSGPAVQLGVTAIGGLLAVGVAQVADLLTFLRMVAVAGIGAELNPLVSRTASVAGLEALIVAKVVLIAVVTGAILATARDYPRVAAIVLTLGTLTGLVGALSNVLAIS